VDFRYGKLPFPSGPALRDDPFFRGAFGAGFVDYYVHIKTAEIERFQTEVSDWEHREYFEMF
jgi:glutamine synthetase